MTQTPLPDGLQPMVLQVLETNGYDGLFNEAPGYDCACKLDDLMPCDAPQMECRPGYLQRLTPAQEAEYEFLIDATKPPTADELEAAGQQRLFDDAEDRG